LDFEHYWVLNKREIQLVEYSLAFVNFVIDTAMGVVVELGLVKLVLGVNQGVDQRINNDP